MALSQSALAVYNQVGFVPEELMTQWAAAGFMIGPVVEWLAIDMNVINTVAIHVGFTMGVACLHDHRPYTVRVGRSTDRPGNWKPKLGDQKLCYVNS